MSTKTTTKIININEPSVSRILQSNVFILGKVVYLKPEYNLLEIIIVLFEVHFVEPCGRTENIIY